MIPIHIIFKLQKIKHTSKAEILKEDIEKHLTNRGARIRITSDSSAEIIQVNEHYDKIKWIFLKNDNT